MSSRLRIAAGCCNLPTGPIRDEGIPGVVFSHGSPFDEDEYILSEGVARNSLEHSPADISFFGHTHFKGQWLSARVSCRSSARSTSTVMAPDTFRLELQPQTRYLINPGSVGQPRDTDWRAGFALYDSEEPSITFYRIPYDVEGAQHRIIGAGLPERLALRLREGR